MIYALSVIRLSLVFNIVRRELIILSEIFFIDLRTVPYRSWCNSRDVTKTPKIEIRGKISKPKIVESSLVRWSLNRWISAAKPRKFLAKYSFQPRNDRLKSW